MATWWFATPDESLIIFYGRFFLMGIFSAGGLIAGSAMLPDMMEYDRHKSGVSQEGLYAATFSLIEKIAYTAGPAMLGILLGVSGFIAVEKGQFVDQPESAIIAIRAAVSFIPAVLSIIGGLVIGFYDLDEAKLKAAQSASTETT
jgi:GPH family glycoside/pentoside/hexuronide:cation symporter